jgi:hypothetical protein
MSSIRVVTARHYVIGITDGRVIRIPGNTKNRVKVHRASL